MKEPEKITIDEVEYVRKDSIKTETKDVNGLEYVICRTYSAGVHAGFLKSRTGKEAELLNARRIYSWQGAATLSQLAMEGSSKPESCKFPCEVNKIILTEVIEVIPCTTVAMCCIREVKVWKE